MVSSQINFPFLFSIILLFRLKSKHGDGCFEKFRPTFLVSIFYLIKQWATSVGDSLSIMSLMSLPQKNVELFFFQKPDDIRKTDGSNEYRSIVRSKLQNCYISDDFFSCQQFSLESFTNHLQGILCFYLGMTIWSILRCWDRNSFLISPILLVALLVSLLHIYGLWRLIYWGKDIIVGRHIAL